jgi:hypothetical protein
MQRQMKTQKMRRSSWLILGLHCQTLKMTRRAVRRMTQRASTSRLNLEENLLLLNLVERTRRGLEMENQKRLRKLTNQINLRRLNRNLSNQIRLRIRVKRRRRRSRLMIKKQRKLLLST